MAIDKSKDTRILNTLHASATDGKLAHADEIFDEEYSGGNKSQHDINEDFNTRITENSLASAAKITITSNGTFKDILNDTTGLFYLDYSLTQEQRTICIRNVTEGSSLIYIKDTNNDMLTGYYSITVTNHVQESITPDNPKGIDAVRMVSISSQATLNLQQYPIYWTIVLDVAVNQYAGDIRISLSQLFNNYGTLPSVKEGSVLAYSSEINQLVYNHNKDWITADGYPAYLKRGTTAQRPTGLTTDDSGYQYYDTTLKTQLWWNGTQWIDPQARDHSITKLEATYDLNLASANKIIILTVGTGGTLTSSTKPVNGYEYQVFIHNTGSTTITVNLGTTWTVMSDQTMEVAAGKWGEVNLVLDDQRGYIRGIGSI